MNTSFSISNVIAILEENISSFLQQGNKPNSSNLPQHLSSIILAMKGLERNSSQCSTKEKKKIVQIIKNLEKTLDKKIIAIQTVSDRRVIDSFNRERENLYTSVAFFDPFISLNNENRDNLALSLFTFDEREVVELEKILSKQILQSDILDDYTATMIFQMARAEFIQEHISDLIAKTNLPGEMLLLYASNRKTTEVLELLKNQKVLERVNNRGLRYLILQVLRTTNLESIQWLMKNLQEINKEGGIELAYEYSLLTGNWNMVKIIGAELNLEEKEMFRDLLFSGIREDDDEPWEKVKKNLLHLFLNTPYSSLAEIVSRKDLHPEIGAVSELIDAIWEKFKEIAPLISLYTNINYLDELNQVYQGGTGRDFYPKNYAIKQWEFGRNCLIVVQNACEKFVRAKANGEKYPAVLNLLSKLAKERVRLAKKTVIRDHMATPFVTTRMDAKEVMLTPISFDPMTGRYWAYLPFIKRTYDLGMAGHYKNELEMQMGESIWSMQIYFDTGKERIPLTKIDTLYEKTGSSPIWFHTKPENLRRIIPHLEKAHQEVFKHELDPSSPESIQELHRKIATAHWLGTQATLTFRGNAQCFQEWLWIAYDFHGFSPPITRSDIPQLDCVALSTPLSQYIQDFLTYFAFIPEFRGDKGIS